MIIEPDKLNELEGFAKLLFCYEDLSLLTGISLDMIMEQVERKEGNLYQVIARGRLKTEAKNRKAIIEMAERGSTPAQKELMLMIEQMKISNISDE